MHDWSADARRQTTGCVPWTSLIGGHCGGLLVEVFHCCFGGRGLRGSAPPAKRCFQRALCRSILGDDLCSSLRMWIMRVTFAGSLPVVGWLVLLELVAYLLVAVFVEPFNAQGDNLGAA